MAEQAAADLAADVAAHEGLFAAIKKWQAATTRVTTNLQKEKYSARINTAGPGGATPLLVACLHGDPEKAKAVLAFGADPKSEGNVWELPHEEETVDVKAQKWKTFPLYIAVQGTGVGHNAIVQMLLAHKSIDVNQGTSDGNASALYVACFVGNQSVVGMLLKCSGIDLNKALKGGDTALYGACYGGHKTIVEMLLMHDAIDVNKAETDHGMTPLFIACYKGYVEVVIVLLKQNAIIDVNKATTDDGTTPLYTACESGQTDLVTLLLAQGKIQVNKATTDVGATPVYIACYKGHTEVLKLLLAHDTVDVNVATTDNGSTPLYTACRQGHTEIVKLLLAQRGGIALGGTVLAHRSAIKVNKATTDVGTTPFNIACYKGHTEVIKLMLNLADKVDVNQARSDGGGCPLYVACGHGHVTIIQMLLALDRTNVNAETTDHARITSLYLACESGLTLVVKLLLSHKRIDVNRPRLDTGATPLFAACLHNRTAIVEMLLEHGGLDVNKARAGGARALHAASNAGNLISAQLLVMHGASLTATTAIGHTAVDIATTVRKVALAEWLKAVDGWSPLRVAAGCRLFGDASLLLRQGKMDPDDPATTTNQEIMAAIATSKASAAALPWRNAPSLCKMTTKLVVDATRGWHTSTHWLHHKAVQHVVFAVVLMVGRLEWKSAVLQATPPAAAAAVDDEKQEALQLLPLLPIGLWFHALSFIKRSWWKV